MSLSEIINKLKYESVSDEELLSIKSLIEKNKVLQTQLYIYDELLNTKITSESVLIRYINTLLSTLDEFDLVEFDIANSKVNSIVFSSSSSDSLINEIGNLIYNYKLNIVGEKFNAMSNVVNNILYKNNIDRELQTLVNVINDKYYTLENEDRTIIKTLINSGDLHETYNQLKDITYTKLHDLRELTSDIDNINKINETLERLNDTPKNLEEEFIHLYNLSTNL